MSARRILAVCTGNVCRSPVAERLLAKHLADAGHAVTVRSAGTHPGVGHDDTSARAALTVGVSLADHAPRRVDADLVATEGADLVVTMTREHLRTVVAMVPGAWPRTFTIKELARRAADHDAPAGAFSDWLAQLADGRRAADMMQPSSDDDLDDPFRQSYATYVRCYETLDALTRRIATAWPA